MHVETAEAWRAWLAEHHADTDGVWLVSWRAPPGRPAARPPGRPAVRYEEAVCAASCFGWVDAQKRTLDDERAVLLFTPRRARSGWARTNKARVERLRAAGLMARPASG